MKIFQVPLREFKVGVTLQGGDDLQGILFTPATGPDGSPGRLVDRLNDVGEHFLPFSCDDDGIILNKSHILTIRLAEDDDSLELHEGGQANRRAVTIWMRGGAKYSGTIAYTMPPEKGRLLDYVNAATPFIPLIGDDGITLVNRDLIERVQEPAQNRTE